MDFISGIIPTEVRYMKWNGDVFMDDLPKISIITPTFNQADFIEETIKSILSQNYPNLEYVIIDGGSTDGTLDIIKKYESHLSYWESSPDRGPWDALNKGFEKVSGEVVAWLNSDDLYAPNVLNTVGRYFQAHPEVLFVYGRNRAVDEGGSDLGTCHCSTQTCWESLIFGGEIINQETCFWRRSIMPPNPVFPSELRYSQTDRWLGFDYDLWIRMLREVRPVYLDMHLGDFRVQKGQRTTDWEDYLVDMRRCRDRELKSCGYAEEKIRHEIDIWTDVVRKKASFRAKELGLSDYFIQPEHIWKAGDFYDKSASCLTDSVSYGSAECMVQASKVLDSVFASFGGTRERQLLLMGAGSFTKRLLSWFAPEEVSIVAVLDDDPQCSEIMGVPVKRPEEFAGTELPVLISTDSIVSTLLQRSVDLGFQNVIKLSVND